MNEHDAPDTITLTETLHEEIRSAGADVTLAVSEGNAFGRSSGRIARLRHTLASRGFEEPDVLLEGVEKTAWAWLPLVAVVPWPFVVLLAYGPRAGLGAALALLALALLLYAVRACSLRARHKLRCRDAAQVHDALDAVLSYGSAEVLAVGWRCEVDALTRSAWAQRCVGRAGQRAQRMAEALGARVLGVHSLREEHAVPSSASAMPVLPEVAARAKKQMSVGESL